MEALWVAACPDEAADFFAFMANAASEGAAGQRLQIMFGVGGEHDLTERILPHLAGWRGSSPVRVDNDACGFLCALAEAATACWRERDHGIWEVRGEPQHFLPSKVMCWVALDRA